MISKASQPAKRPAYPAYKPSGVQWLGDVPEHWGVLSVKFALAMPITDGPHETPEILDEGVPFLSAEAVKDDRLDFDKKRGFISREDHARYSKKYRPCRGDVYMVKSGATTGNVARVQTDEEFNIWSPLAALRPHPLRMTTDFLFYFMRSRPFFVSVELNWSYGTQQNIGMGVIGDLPIAAPSLPEQRTIAAFLDRETGRIDALIAKKQRQIELLQEKRPALISHAVTKGLDPTAPMKDSGIDWLGQVPEHWEVKRLRHITPKLGVGLVINPSTYVDEAGDVPFFFGSNVEEYRLRPEGARRITQESNTKLVQSRLRTGDLVTCTRRGSRHICSCPPRARQFQLCFHHDHPKVFELFVGVVVLCPQLRLGKIPG